VIGQKAVFLTVTDYPLCYDLRNFAHVTFVVEEILAGYVLT